jgi:hypothetical protein
VASLTRGRVCNLQCNRWLVRWLRANNHTLPSHLRLCFLFVTSYDSKGLWWRYSNPWLALYGASSTKWADVKWVSSYQQMARSAFVANATFPFDTAGRWNCVMICRIIYFNTFGRKIWYKFPLHPVLLSVLIHAMVIIPCSLMRVPHSKSVKDEIRRCRSVTGVKNCCCRISVENERQNTWYPYMSRDSFYSWIATHITLFP